MKTPDSRDAFAKMYGFYHMFWLFFTASVAGCIIEVLFAYVRYGSLQSRVGVVYGPFNQIYGLAAIVIVLLIHKIFGEKYIHLFLVSGVIGAAFEFVSSLMQQLLLGSVSWDYSAHPLNIFGRTSLIYSVYWGLLGYFLIKFFYPALNKILERIPRRIGVISSWLLIIIVSFDLLLSAAAVDRAHQRYHNIPATNVIQAKLDEWYPDSFIEKTYPNLRFVGNVS